MTVSLTKYQLNAPRKDILVSLFTLCSLSSLISFGNGHNLAGALLILPALFLCAPIKFSEIPTTFWILSGSFFCFVLLSFLSFLIQGGELSDVDQPSRFILVIPIILMLLKYPPRMNWIVVGIAITAILSYGAALVQIHYLGFERGLTGIDDNFWFNGYMPIQHGDMAMTMSLVSACFFIFLYKQQKKWLYLLAFLGFICGLSASLLSGSRGGWIIVPVIFLYIAYINKDIFKNKAILFLSLVIIACSTITLSQMDQFRDRLTAISEDLTKFDQGDVETSVGVRFGLWQSAILTAKEYPIFGAGKVKRAQSRLAQLKSGSIPDITKGRAIHSHAHNQYLEYLSLYGLVGLTLLLFVFLYPLYLFLKLTPKSVEQNILRHCGIIHILGVMGYCLTQSYFAHNSGAIFYPLILIIFLTASGALEIKSQCLENINNEVEKL